MLSKNLPINKKYCAKCIIVVVVRILLDYLFINLFYYFIRLVWLHILLFAFSKIANVRKPTVPNLNFNKRSYKFGYLVNVFSSRT